MKKAHRLFECFTLAINACRQIGTPAANEACDITQNAVYFLRTQNRVTFANVARITCTFAAQDDLFCHFLDCGGNSIGTFTIRLISQHDFAILATDGLGRVARPYLNQYFSERKY